MKKILITAVSITASMLLIPLGVLSEPEKTVPTSVVTNSIASPKTLDSLSGAENFRVYDEETGEITELMKNEYLFGVVAAEMPALYHEEALKAQAVTAYTFALSRKQENKDKDYDITNSHLSDQSFITKEAAALKWGENAAVYIEKIENAIKEAEDFVITYNGSPITAVYHAISSGRTESSADIWGMDKPYLVPVASEDDILAENYRTDITFTANELKNLIPKLSLEESLTFGQSVKTESGAVKKIEICGEIFSGAEIRELLNLRSSNFKVTQNADNFTFSVYGYGHGVGMSQNGANCMAEKGCTFKEILAHYYTDCKIEKITTA